MTYKYRCWVNNDSICVFLIPHSANSSIDFYMSQQFVESDSFDDPFFKKTEALYPHDMECLRFFVPQQFKIENVIKKFIQHGDVQAIGFALVVFVLARIFIQRAYWKDWHSITLNTLQFFLAQGQINNQNAVEDAWANILRGFSLFAISTISAILYKSLVQVQPHEIDTVADLIASNLTIIVPESLRSHFDSVDSKIT